MANLDKEQAIHAFWSSFNLAAYDESTVPTEENAPDFPYITYNVVTDSFDGTDADTAMYASLWYKSRSWADITAKKDEISEAIGYGGKRIPIDGGYLWIKRGTPFAQRLADDSDDTIRRIYINISVSFLTAN